MIKLAAPIYFTCLDVVDFWHFKSFKFLKNIYKLGLNLKPLEQLTNFMSDMKKRFAGPFFASFLVSWIIINWKVPIALLFYSHDDILRDGYRSYIELITLNVVHPKAVFMPSIYALSYTILFPFFKSFLKMFSSWVETRTEVAVERIVKSGYTKTEKAIVAKIEYTNKLKQLEKAFNREIQDDYDRVQAQKVINDLKDELMAANQKLNALSSVELDRDRLDRISYQNMNDLKKLSNELNTLRLEREELFNRLATLSNKYGDVESENQILKERFIKEPARKNPTLYYNSRGNKEADTMTTITPEGKIQNNYLLTQAEQDKLLLILIEKFGSIENYVKENVDISSLVKELSSEFKFPLYKKVYKNNQLRSKLNELKTA